MSFFVKIASVFSGPGKKKDPRKKLGDKGEKLAAGFYRNMGFAILDRNYVCAIGELDLVVRKEDLLVFCEVKTRSSDSFGPPEMAVTHAKRKRIVKLAKYYISQKKLQSQTVRFDVVSIVWEKDGRPRLKHIPAAFTAR